MNDRKISAHAARVYRTALVWDAHAGFEYAEGTDLTELDRWRVAGVDYLSVNVGYDVRPWERTVKALADYRRFIAAHPDRFVLIETVADIRRAKDEGKLAIGFDIEGMGCLDEDLNMVALYHRLGVRQMLIAYNLNNAAGGGCHDADIGLTDFGRSVIAEMNRLGMLVDCSHTAYRSTMEAMEISSSPVIFSHSNARALQDHERNIRDEQIHKAGASGGMVGVTGIGLFLSHEGATVEALVRHIDYIADLIGIDRVGIGLDYAMDQPELDDTFVTHPRYWPKRQYPSGGDIGYLAPACFPRIAQALLDRGYGDDEVRGVLGENFMRTAERVWAASSPAEHTP